MVWDVPVLRGRRVRLRPWRDDDHDVVAAMRFDPVISRWSRQFEEPAEWIARQHCDGDGVCLAITELHEQAAVGKIALGRFQPAMPTAELSYWLLTDARGRGLATDAGRALCAWAFACAAVERILLRVEVENIACHRVARALGAQVPVLRPYVECDRHGLRRHLMFYVLRDSDLRRAPAGSRFRRVERLPQIASCRPV